MCELLLGMRAVNIDENSNDMLKWISINSNYKYMPEERRTGWRTVQKQT